MNILGFSLAFFILCTTQVMSSNSSFSEDLDKNQKLNFVNKEIKDLFEILEQLDEEQKKSGNVPQSVKEHYKKYKNDFIVLEYKLDNNPDMDVQKEKFLIHQKNNSILGFFN